ncbi:DUF6220 domain-containing protein [Micromonospora sp. MS34]|uniref:DUF6220 domain-containing protein n=1 Tax=Micromonospora sp. MS34 TaxID=3385971 RepID=UPI0039A2F195
MRKVYVILVGLLTVSIAVQFYLAASGAFETPQTDDSFAAHRTVGFMVIPGLALLATLAGALARVGGRLIALTILPVGLVVLQSVTRVVADAFNTSAGDSTGVSTAIFGLHALNGLAIMALSGYLMRRARALLRGPQPSEPARAPESTAA